MNQDEINKINQDFDLFFMYEDFNKDKALDFIYKGADPNNGILFNVVENTEVEKVKFLLEHGANPNKEFEGHFITEYIYSYLENIYSLEPTFSNLDDDLENEFKEIIHLLLRYDMNINIKPMNCNKTLLDNFILFRSQFADLSYEKYRYSFGESMEKFLRSVGAKTSEELEQENKN